MSMKLKTFMAYCLSKPGVTDDYPMKGEAVWMKVKGKMFAMTNVRELKMDGELVQPFHFINLKCDPAWADDLRQEHDAIRPGWHQNKTHWNSLMMGQGLTDALIRQLTDHSYDIVVSSLPKKVQAELSDT